MMCQPCVSCMIKFNFAAHLRSVDSYVIISACAKCLGYPSAACNDLKCPPLANTESVRGKNKVMPRYAKWLLQIACKVNRKD
jgi:hypothetical protein